MIMQFFSHSQFLVSNPVPRRWFRNGSGHYRGEGAAQTTTLLFIISVLKAPGGLSQHQHRELTAWGSKPAAAALVWLSWDELKLDSRSRKPALLLPLSPLLSQSSQPASQALRTRGSSTTAIPPHSLQTCLIPPRLLPSCIYINLYLSPTIAQFSLFIYLPVDSFYNLSLDSHRARDRTSCCGMH